MDYFPIPNDIFTSICMDFLQLEPCKDHDDKTYDYVLVIVCRLSGYVMAIPCRKAGLTAEHCARLFLEHVVAFFGLPFEIMSDNDHLINSKFMQTVCTLAGISQHTSILYRPQGNGRAEAAVRAVVDILRKSLTAHPRPWIQALPWCLWQLNDLPGVDGSHSPHKIIFGRDLIGFGDHPALHHPRSSAAAEEWMQNIQKMRKEVQSTVQKLHNHLSHKFMQHRKTVIYEPGDRVWVRNLPDQAGKLDPLWTGPCEVLQRRGNSGRYQIALPDSVQDIHMERLKMYLPRIDGTKIHLHYYRPVEQVPEDDSLLVEKIIDHRTRNGTLQWLVTWKGYDHAHNTWEPASSFVGYVQQDWVEYNKRHKIQVPLNKQF